MIGFYSLPDKVFIYPKDHVDDWGVTVSNNEGVEVNARIKESFDYKEMKDQSGKNVVVSYEVLIENTHTVHRGDRIGFEVSGSIKKFEILNATRSRDLSGELLYSKVLV